MRLLAMLLMLCLLLAAADAQLKCDKSLIKGVTEAEFQLDSEIKSYTALRKKKLHPEMQFESKTLVCTGRANYFTMITFKEKDGSDSIPHASLICDNDDGWTTESIDTNYRKKKGDVMFDAHKIAEASSPLNITCVNYCSYFGAGLKIKKEVPSLEQISEYLAERHLSLTPSNNDCELYFGWQKLSSEALCDPYDGWFHEHQLLSRDTSVPQHFECRRKNVPPPACTVVKEVSYDHYLDINQVTGTLTCRRTTDNVAGSVAFDRIPYDSLMCDEDEGWTANGQVYRNGEWTRGKIAEATSPLKVTCNEKSRDYHFLKCEKKKIHEVTNGKIQFDKVGERNYSLTCPKNTNSLMMIHFQEKDGSNSIPHAKLICHKDDGWNTLNTKAYFDAKVIKGIYEKHTITKPDAPLNIACVEYCASTGNGLKITAREINNPPAYDNPSYPYSLITISSNDQDYILYFAWIKLTEEAECSPYEGWYVRNRLVTTESTKPQHFERRLKTDPAPPCTVTLDANMKTIFENLNVNLLTKTLSCHRHRNNSLRAIVYKNSQTLVRYGSLECDEVNGWKSNSRLENNERFIIEEQKVANADKEFVVKECAEYCEATGEGIIYEQRGENAEVRCRSDANLVYNEKIVTSAKCTLAGKWNMQTENSEIYVELKMDKPAEFECRPKKCYMSKTEGAHFDKATKTLTCDETPNTPMAIQLNSELFTSVTCDVVEGWKGKMKKIVEASSQLAFKCVQYCNQNERTDQVQATEQTDSIEFTCKNNDANEARNELRMNGNFVKSPLKCDIGGYSDATNLKLAGPLDTVKLECTTTKTSTTTTTISTITDASTTESSKIEKSQAQSSSSSKSVVIGASIGGVLLVIIAIVIVFFVLKKRRRPQNSENGKSGKSEGRNDKNRKGNEKSGADQPFSGP